MECPERPSKRRTEVETASGGVSVDDIYIPIDEEVTNLKYLDETDSLEEIRPGGRFTVVSNGHPHDTKVYYIDPNENVVDVSSAIMEINYNLDAADVSSSLTLRVYHHESKNSRFSTIFKNLHSDTTTVQSVVLEDQGRADENQSLQLAMSKRDTEPVIHPSEANKAQTPYGEMPYALGSNTPVLTGSHYKWFMYSNSELEKGNQPLGYFEWKELNNVD